MTHIERSAIDVELALRQHEGYMTAFAAHGWRVHEVPPADDCPDSAFIEDTVVVCAGTAVITWAGALVRRPETAGVEATVRELGLAVTHIEDPGSIKALRGTPIGSHRAGSGRCRRLVVPCVRGLFPSSRGQRGGRSESLWCQHGRARARSRRYRCPRAAVPSHSTPTTPACGYFWRTGPAEGSETLGAAISEADTEIVRLLLDAGIDPRIPIPDDTSDEEASVPPVRAAIQYRCDAEMIELLLTRGADPDPDPGAASDDLITCSLAVRQGEPPIINLLRSHGAHDDITITDEFLAACARADRSTAGRLVRTNPGLMAHLSTPGPRRPRKRRLDSRWSDASVASPSWADGSLVAPV